MASFLAGAAAGAALSAALAFFLMRRRLGRLGRFFSFVAHEINTPVTAINMTVINMSSGVFGEIPKEQVRWVEMLREQAGRLNALVGELRDILHIEFARDLLLSTEEEDVSGLIQEALSGLRHGLRQAGVEAEVRLEDGLPKVRADRDRTVRTLASLIFHARKFRLEGGISIEARRRGADDVVVELRYRGPALPAEEVRGSLEVFYPAQRAQDELLAATGLGLGALRALARRQGGELDFRVEEDGNSILSLVLPARRMVQSKGHGH